MTAPFVPLLDSLSADVEDGWLDANTRLLWGWKRDRERASRLVFYAGRLERRGEMIGVTGQHLLYVHRTDAGHASRFARVFEEGRAGIEAALGRMTVEVRRGRRGQATVEVQAGTPAPDEVALTARLRRRRPRTSIPAVPAVTPRPLRDLARLFPADLYLGSGVSYEAGLPTLCDMHDAFCVDDPAGSQFTVGAADVLPQRLASDPFETVAAFAQVHTAALRAAPTRAMRIIAELHDRGLIGELYTDNVDNLIAKVGLPFTRTRGSGVLNERCAVTVGSPRLIVVGVAADRREVVAQARGRGRSVVVVNPCLRVAPHVRHLTYLRETDVFFRETADDFFTRVAEELELTGTTVAAGAPAIQSV